VGILTMKGVKGWFQESRVVVVMKGRARRRRALG